VAAAWEDHRSALLLFGAADALRELVGTAMLWPADIAAVERSLAMLRGVLGEARVKSILGEGRKVPLQEAVAVAARDIRPPTTTSAGDRSPDAFTRRERDVLALLAANQMDQEIAAALFLSPRTVNWHVRSILAKLGVSSRREAVVRARAAGLV
jgi:DNA-binding CsgD family transcriptional regulator